MTSLSVTGHDATSPKVIAPRAADQAVAKRAAVCCGRPMSTIEVTSPLAAPGATLALHTCSSCGLHIWEREGQVLDHDAVLGIVRDRIAEGPAPRVPTPRKVRPSRARVAGVDVRERLSEFTIHGT